MRVTESSPVSTSAKCKKLMGEEAHSAFPTKAFVWITYLKGSGHYQKNKGTQR